MLARVDFTVSGQPMTAWLNDAGKWECADPETAKTLNRFCGPSVPGFLEALGSPGHGPFGFAMARKATERLNGTMTWLAPPSNYPASAIF